MVEKMYSPHGARAWFKAKGRDPIFAAGKHVPLGPVDGPAEGLPLIPEIGEPDGGGPIGPDAPVSLLQADDAAGQANGSARLLLCRESATGSTRRHTGMSVPPTRSETR